MPAQMSSEKFMRAERKNRLEGHKLKVTCTHYNKETTRLNFEIDREKRGIIKAFRNVIKTSGASDLGLPPDHDNDTDYEKCPSYMQGLKLSNKRLLEWRECEKQLTNFLRNSEAERTKEKRRFVIKKSLEDYRVIPPKRFDDIEDDVFLDDAMSVATSEKTSPIDLLKENPDDKEEQFDIKKWEADIIENYKTSVCKFSTSSPSSETSVNLRSKSSPAIMTRTRESNKEPKRARPHTAQARIRPPSGRSTVPRRPASANVGHLENQSKFLITKESTYMKNGHTFEKLLDNRSVDKPLMINNYLSSLAPPSTNVAEKAPSVASVGTLCPVVEDNEENEDDMNSFDKADGQTVTSDDVVNNNVTDQARSEDKITGRERETDFSESQLSLKFQRRLKKKLHRVRSANSGLGAQHSNIRNLLKHSNSDLSAFMEGSGRRSRHDSESMSSMVSVPMSRTGSIVSSHRPSISLGIPSDIDEISRGQEKLVSEITPEKPLSTNKLVSIKYVVRAAMTFSRLARKKALARMQSENSSDAHEIIRQERLRKLQSRQQVLNSIANQWQGDPDLTDNVTIQQVQ